MGGWGACVGVGACVDSLDLMNGRLGSTRVLVNAAEWVRSGDACAVSEWYVMWSMCVQFARLYRSAVGTDVWASRCCQLSGCC